MLIAYFPSGTARSDHSYEPDLDSSRYKFIAYLPIGAARIDRSCEPALDGTQHRRLVEARVHRAFRRAPARNRRSYEPAVRDPSSRHMLIAYFPSGTARTDHSYEPDLDSSRHLFIAHLPMGAPRIVRSHGPTLHRR